MALYNIKILFISSHSLGLLELTSVKANIGLNPTSRLDLLDYINYYLSGNVNSFTTSSSLSLLKVTLLEVLSFSIISNRSIPVPSCSSFRLAIYLLLLLPSSCTSSSIDIVEGLLYSSIKDIIFSYVDLILFNSIRRVLLGTQTYF